MAAGAEGHSPLHQFEIHTLFGFQPAGLNLDFTNSALMMLIAIGLASFFMIFGMRNASLVPSRFQSAVELSYEMIANMVKDSVGTAGMKYFPFVFSLFMFVLFCNLLGMMPYSFTATSHIAVTLALAAMVFIAVLVIGFARHGLHFFHLFVPSGLPKIMLLFIVPIEIFSFLIRPMTLSIRLAANMTAGHILLKVFAGFVASGIAAGGLGYAIGGISQLMVIVFVGFEFFVAFLQAYIFTILTCVYLNDAVNMH